MESVGILHMAIRIRQSCKVSSCASSLPASGCVAGACSMDVIPHKWQAFADKQVKLRAARQAKESSLALQVCETDWEAGLLRPVGQKGQAGPLITSCMYDLYQSMIC